MTSTYRPRARVKATPLVPTLPIGAPFVPPSVRIPEPATLTGDWTGKPYVNVGDSPNGPEGFQVTPPARRAVANPAPTSMAGGGSAVVGPDAEDADFFDMVNRLHHGSRALVNRKPVSMALGGAGQVGPDYTPDDFANAPSGSSQADAYQQYQQQPQAPAPQPVSRATVNPSPQASIYDPAQAAYQQQGNVYNAQTLGANARDNVYAATAGTFAPQSQYIDQEGRVVDASDATNAKTRALVNVQQQDTAASQQEQAALEASANNLPDLVAVARAKQVRADREAEDQRFDQLSAPQEVVVPEGDKSALPSGVVAKLETQNDVQTRQFAAADKTRALQVDAAREIVSLAQTDETAADNLAKRYGLSVDKAKLLVSEAENTANVADNNTTRAIISLNRTKLTDPTKVEYQDPQTGETRLVSPAEKMTLDEQDKRNFALTTPGDVLYTDPYTKTKSYMSQAEADQRRHDYEQQQGAANYQIDANYNAGKVPAQTAATEAQEAQYRADPDHAPIDWLLKNMTVATTSSTGVTTTNQGLFDRARVIQILTNRGYSYVDAINATAPSTATGGANSGFGSAGTNTR